MHVCTCLCYRNDHFNSLAWPSGRLVRLTMDREVGRSNQLEPGRELAQHAAVYKIMYKCSLQVRLLTFSANHFMIQALSAASVNICLIKVVYYHKTHQICNMYLFIRKHAIGTVQLPFIFPPRDTAFVIS